MTELRPKSKRSAALKGLAVMMILILFITNVITLYMLIKTGFALQEAMESKPVIVNQIVDRPEPEEEMVPSIPVSLFMKYAQSDKISIEFLQRFFNDRILIWYKEQLHSIAIDDSLKKSDFDRKYIVYNENGIRRYEPQEGEDISLLGIDVSSYQGNINWNKVKAAGVDYAIIRLGYRGYGTGAVMLDTKFHTNMKNAASAGIPTGVYFYSQAINEEEAIEEAETVIKNLKGYNISYPVVFDMEEVNDDPEDVRTSQLTPKQRTDITIAFCERIREAGYTPMVYGNISWMIMNLEFERLEEYDKWFAQYFKQPFFPYEFAMWQYTPNGKIDGIEGGVDLNMGFVDYSSVPKNKTTN